MQFARGRVLLGALLIAFSNAWQAQADVPIKPVDLKALNEHTFTPVLRDATGTDADSVQLTEGAHLYRSGKIDEAAAVFDKVIKRSPHNGEALFDMAIAKQASNNLSGATDFYRRACEENRDKRKYADALQEVQRQLRIDVLCNIAANAIKSGDVNNALSVYKQLDGVVHDAAIVKYDIGALYLRNNDPSSAKSYLLQAAALKPSNVDYKKALDECIAAQASSTGVASSSSSSSSSASALPSSNSSSSTANGSGSTVVSLPSATAKPSDSAASSASSGTSSSSDTTGGSGGDYSLSNGFRAKTLSMDNVSFVDSGASKDKAISDNKIASAAPVGSTNAGAAANSTAANSTSAGGSASGTQTSSTNATTNLSSAAPSSSTGSSGSTSESSSTKSDNSASSGGTTDSSKGVNKPSDVAPNVDPATKAKWTETVGFNNTGVRALAKGDYDTAIASFKLALQNDPRYKLAEKNLAIAYNNLGLQLRGTPDKSLYQFHQAFYLDRTNRTTAQNIVGMIKIKGLDANNAGDRDKLAKEELANNDPIGFHIESDAADWLRNNPGKPWIDGLAQPVGDPGIVNFGPYMAELQKRIKHNWYPPKGKETERVVTAFKISADGSISNLHVKQSAKITDVDQAALKAVEASKFSPLPVGAAASVDVEFTFDYNVFVGKNLLKRKDDNANQANSDKAKDGAIPAKGGDDARAKDASASQGKSGSANQGKSGAASQGKSGSASQGNGGSANQENDGTSSQRRSGAVKKAKPKPKPSGNN